MTRFKRIDINGHKGYRTKSAYGIEIFLLKRKIGWVAYDLETMARLTSQPTETRTRATQKAGAMIKRIAADKESYVKFLTLELHE